MGTVTAFKDIGLPSSTRPRGISRQSFLVYLLDLRIRVTVAFLDFVTLSPLILRIHLGIKFLFVRLRFRYPFFSPAPRDTNLGSRFRVRRQLRPGGLSPQTDGMPVIHKKALRYILRAEKSAVYAASWLSVYYSNSVVRSHFILLPDFRTNKTE